MSTRVSIVEDDDELRESLAILINGAPGYRCVSHYGEGEAACAGLVQEQPDVVIMDINLPRMSGIECVAKLRSAGLKCLFMMLTVHEDDEIIFQALQAGASGYLLKETAPSALLDAISELKKGGSPMSSSIARRVIKYFHREPSKGQQATMENLTKREREVLVLLTKGYLYKEIAAQLGISFDTVHTHIRNIYEKLHVRSRSEAIAAYLGA